MKIKQCKERRLYDDSVIGTIVVRCMLARPHKDFHIGFTGAYLLGWRFQEGEAVIQMAEEDDLSPVKKAKVKRKLPDGYGD